MKNWKEEATEIYSEEIDGLVTDFLDGKANEIMVLEPFAKWPDWLKNKFEEEEPEDYATQVLEAEMWEKEYALEGLIIERDTMPEYYTPEDKAEKEAEIKAMEAEIEKLKAKGVPSQI